MVRALKIFGRAALLRCPNCGASRLFRRWFTMRPYCPACGLRLEREEGFHTGGMAVNLVIAELLFVALFVAILVVSWPNPPWEFLRWGSMVLMVLFPIVFYPFSRALWLALDLVIRPVEREEIIDPALPQEQANPA